MPQLVQDALVAIVAALPQVGQGVGQGAGAVGQKKTQDVNAVIPVGHGQFHAGDDLDAVRLARRLRASGRPARVSWSVRATAAMPFGAATATSSAAKASRRKPWSGYVNR
ncbi:MAG: hypothetical protein AB9872_07885 [Solidesulfovibrio sp.]